MRLEVDGGSGDGGFVAEDGVEKVGGFWNALPGEFRAGFFGDCASLSHGGVEGKQPGVRDEREALARGSGNVLVFGHGFAGGQWSWDIRLMRL